MDLGIFAVVLSIAYLSASLAFKIQYVVMAAIADFRRCVEKAPQSDMDILGIKRGPDLQFAAEMVQATRSSCMLVADSGLESALA